jgi:co-chaperonin GroES (HSP10)
MAITPTGHRVLIEQEDLQEHDEVYKRAKAAGLEIQLDRNVKAQEGVDVGIVRKIGLTAWKDFGGEPWCKVGDKVVFAKYAGKKVEDPADKAKHFTILNDEDVVAVITE